jgi:hypothetical protein
LSSAAERHTKHGGALEALTTEAQTARLWRTGNGDPHRGAEARITRLEEGALMEADLDRLVTKAVSKYLRSVRGILASALPWVVFIAGVILYLTSGRAPPALP